jgi:hypothetical protein
MAGARTDATVLDGATPETKGWYAWNDLMPPRPDEVHVIGEVLVPNPGVEPELTYRIPQGINPAILLLDLRLVQKAGLWPEILTWKPVRYSAVLGVTTYSQAVILHGNETLVGLDAETVHLAGGAGLDAAAYRIFRSGHWAGHGDAAPQPRRAAQGWSGENPFPWLSSRHHVCLSGSLSKIQVDVCRDGVPYALTMHGGVRVRVRGANDGVANRLEEFSVQRIIITVCGRFAWSPEQGCQYMLGDSAEPAEDFSARLQARP